MTFGESVGTCMRKYADFTGRARRSEYWWFYLAASLIMIPFVIAFSVTLFVAGEELWVTIEDERSITMRQVIDGIDWERLTGPGILLGAVWLFLLVPLMAATARRLHDVGLSAWAMLVWLIPYVGSAVLIVLCILDSQARDNRHGPDPKAGERALWGSVPSEPPPPGG